MGQLNQYEEVTQRISRLLHEAAQRGHVEVKRAAMHAEVPSSNEARERVELTENRGGISCEYLTPRDVAAFLNLSTDMVYTMLREGELPAIRLGAGKRQVWRIPLGEFRRYLSAIRTGPELG